MENYFLEMYSVNVSDKIEKKNGLSYLSWAWAWAELKKLHPDASSKVYENHDGWNYFTDGKTGWVKTGVTVNGLEHIEYLPIMDFRSDSIPIEKITSKDVNKSIQRSMTKAIGRHGLGLSIYVGEDLPESDNPTNQERAPEKSDHPTAREQCSALSKELDIPEDEKKQMWLESGENYSNLFIMLKSLKAERDKVIAGMSKKLDRAGV